MSSFDDDHRTALMTPDPEGDMNEVTRTYSFDDAMEEIGFGQYHFILMQVCGAGYFFDGIELSLSSFIIDPIIVEMNISDVAAAALGSIVFIGMAFGAYLSGVIADKYGRKPIFCGSVLVVSMFGLLSAFSPNYPILMILRFFVGVGLGGIPPTDHSMLMEFSPKSSRGLSMGSLQVYNAVGGMFECLLAYLCLGRGFNVNGWRYLVGASAAPGFFIFFARLFVSESPRYMMINGRYNETKELIKKIALTNGKEEPVGRLIAPVPESKLSVVNQLLGVLSRGYLRSTLLLWLVWFLIAYGGWGFSFLSPLTYEKLGANTYLSTFYGSLVTFVGSVLVMFYINLVRRKPVLIVGFLLSGVLLAVTGAYNNVTYMTVFITVSSFVITPPWNALYVLTAETYPTSFRATAMGSCSVFYRLGATVTSLSGLPLLSAYGYVWPYFSFGLALLIAGFLCIFLPNDVLGQSSEDVAHERKSHGGDLIQPHIQEKVLELGSAQELDDFDNNEYNKLENKDD
ncbi:svop [Acrasis kona]|uniref:Svop n=1 Tax=Acrasis kona TaxID=1008807 RepID=A0AAW2YTU2_9EUKA